MTLRALVVDDDEGVRYTLRAFLEDAGLEVTEAEDGIQGLARVEADEPALVLLDVRMPRMDGLTMLRHLRERPRMPVVVMVTAQATERDQIEAIKLGAFDSFRKPFEPEALDAVLARVRALVEERSARERLEGEVAMTGGFVSQAPEMTRLASRLARVAKRDVTVLITGESGTGKERIAEAIVRGSPRARRPYVRFNCAAIPPDLAEAELFGHGRGAFTGAHRARPGLFRVAHGGTLLLDEVGDLDLRTQASLLRVLQEGEVRPVGEEHPVPVDVRLLAATHRDLGERVRGGAFREDLYYRLKVVELRVPPLRERPEDIGPLAQHFLRVHARRFGLNEHRLSKEAIAALEAHPWPGNVRELANLLEGLVAMSEDGAIDESLLPREKHATPLEVGLRERVESFERGVLTRTLEATGQNRSEAARRLQISRATLHEKLLKYGLGEA